MSEQQQIPGKFVWFELLTSAPAKAQAFYGEVLGWRVQSFPMGPASYDMILTGASLDSMIGGFAAPPNPGEPSRWIAYMSVEDVDAAARAATEHGGVVLGSPTDIPGVGRRARIADPQGAEMAILKRDQGDPPDAPKSVPVGHWMWNELHTTDPAAALAFYQAVLGLSHRTLDMGPAGSYHIVSRGGVDRGGVTGHVGGAAPHWLPYVLVEDPDATLARAGTHGGTVEVGPMDIPGIGRFGVFRDPTGAALAVMKPAPGQADG